MKLEDNRGMKISVRNLVEFVLRSGDLDNRRTAGAQRDAMLAGARIHRKIQRQMGPSYQAEVSLKYLAREEEFDLLVEGRADGIFTEQDLVTVDEIKGVYFDIQRLEEPVPVHLAQAMCYAYFYCMEKGESRIGVRLTYCNLETEEIRYFEQVKTVEELAEWFAGVLHEYMKWARYLYHNGLRRDESLRQLEFPFPYREGQRELAVSVYRTVRRKKKIFIQAPTGIGKTLSTVFPSLKAIGEGHGEKLFYLTAKTVTRGVAEEAFSLLREGGLYFKSVTITSKEKLCFQEKPECNPDACPYAQGHYDRVNEAVYDIIHMENGITRELVLQYAKENQVCPFEFCLDISSWVDGIICDYNYVFDPNVRLKRYFGEGVVGDYIFLVDEAHNLVSRAREMYSASIVKEEFLLIKKVLQDKSKRVASHLKRCNQLLLDLKRECQTYQMLADANHLVLAIQPLFEEIEKLLDDWREFDGRDQVLDFYFTLRDFLNIGDGVDEHYRVYAELLKDGQFMVKLLCVNPVRRLKECLAQGRSTVFFSATMLPIQYYRELLSNEPEDYAVYVNSPFPEENRLLLVASDVTSKYTHRNESEYRKILSYLGSLAETRRGNYMVFFPSYQYLEDVYQCYLREAESCAGYTCMVQGSRMSEQERDAFLNEFELERQDTLMAFCVMGGLFSEGIDLKEERLIGAVVVGTGLPMICTEQEIFRDYFESQNRAGFDFAYQFPGMNKVMQSAGRVIRTFSDIGVILLLDQRFLKWDYQSMFPREWSQFQVVNANSVSGYLRDFWSCNDGDTK